MYEGIHLISYIVFLKETKVGGNMNKSKLSVRQMCVLALFLAIEIIMYLTPIGYLRINALSVTLMHVPVIILASTMGPAAGAFLGFVFGCTSVIGATMTPGITSFVFSPFITVGGISGNFFSLVIALVPRILLGVIAGYVFKFAKKYAKNTPVAAGIAAAVRPPADDRHHFPRVGTGRTVRGTASGGKKRKRQPCDLPL